MDSDATGFEQSSLIGERLGSIGGKPLPRRPEDRSLRPLWRLRRPKPGPLDRRPDDIAVDPLQRLGDRHDRDGGAVPRGRPSDRTDERGVDERPRSIVDEDDPLLIRYAGPVEGEDPGVARFLTSTPAWDDVNDGRR